MGNIISFFSGLVVMDWLSGNMVSDAIVSGAAVLSSGLCYASSSWWLSRIFLVMFSVYLGFRFYGIYKIKGRLKKYHGAKHAKYTSLGEKLKALESPIENSKKYPTMKMTELQSLLIAEKSVDPIDVLEAFQVSCLQMANNEKGCIAEISFDADVTALLSETALQKGVASRIHGLPIAVQDSLCIEKIQPTGGLSYVDKNFQVQNCVIVDTLKYSAMAVPFLSTNTSTFYNNWITKNKLFGKCCLPSYPDRVFLGNSGGLVATILRNGAPVGVGLDYLGGLRIPASFGGLASLQTSSRISNKGLYITEGVRGLPLDIAVGPVGRTVDNVIDVFSALVSPYMHELDPIKPYIPVDKKKLYETEKLNIGYFVQLADSLPVLPCMERAMSDAVTVLKSKGHNLIEFPLPDVEDFVYITLSCMYQIDKEGYDFLMNKAGGDFISMKDKARIYLHNIPSCMNIVALTILKLAQFKSKLIAKCIQKIVQRNESVSSLQQKAESIKAKFEKSWNSANLDALVCPVTPYSAMTEPGCEEILTTLSYSSFVNICGFSAGCIQTSSISKEDINAVTSIDMSQIYPANVLASQTTAQGLPIAVQIVGKPYNEETILNLMRCLENSLFTHI